MGYQNFPGEGGDSDSKGKLRAIQLPHSIAGKSLLDIGCNEGFFCAAALDRGATRVVGVDINKEIIEKARSRVTRAEFFNSSWWDLPAEKFDYILFLSAAHYEKDQKSLFSLLHNHLTTEGVLILECGVNTDVEGRSWSAIPRHDGVFMYPSFSLLVEELLEDFAVRDIGSSVMQEGDPVPRIVFHCRKSKPIVILVCGASGSGKTVLTREFSKIGGRSINLDFYFTNLSRNMFTWNDPKTHYLIDNFVASSIDIFLRKAAEDDKIDLINSLVERLVLPDRRLTMLEGYQFSIPGFTEDLTEKLTKRGFIVKTIAM